MTTTSSEPWTTRRLLAWMTEAFTKHDLDSPRLFAEMLVSHVLSCERLKLYMDPDRPASNQERDTLRALVGRALKHEPVQYLVGEAWFFGMRFLVDRRVLVPRPATETIVEEVLQGARDVGGLRLADICTGSGCIAVAILSRLPQAIAVASDLSPDALAVARENATRHKVIDRLDFRTADLCASLANEAPFDVIASNPPYIPDHEWDAVEPNVRLHEPESALRAGADGLDLIRPLLRDAPGFLRPGGRLLIETAASTADQVLAMAQADPRLAESRILPDFEGLPRVLAAVRAT